MKLLTNDEFNKLQLPADITPKVIDACKSIFIGDMPLNSAARTCNIKGPHEMLNLFNAMEVIIKQLDE